MKKWLILLACAWTLQAGMLDFVTLHKAKEAYAAGRYAEAARLYEEAARETGSDAARLDAGDAWYKAGDLKKALALYQSVREPALQFQKWHNLGNTYARLGRIDRGIDAYKKALKIRKDPDTKFNLELLEKLKKERQKHKSEKERKKNRNEQKKKGGQNKRQNQNAGNQKNQKSPQQSGEGQKEKRNGQKGRPGQKNRESAKKEKKKGQEGAKKENRSPNGKRNRSEAEKAAARARAEAMKKAARRNEPISDMELRKWEKSLNRRGIHTLMLPMPTQKSQRNENETNPW